MFENSFFPCCVKEWIKVIEKIRNIETINNFKVTGLKSKRNSVFVTHGIKLLSRLRLNFSHLNEQKFWHNFNDKVNPMCKCGLEPDTTLHYLLRCNLYSNPRLELLNSVRILNPLLKFFSNKKLLNIFLNESEYFNCNINKKIMKATIKFLK